MAANRFDQLIEEWSPRLRRAFLDAVYGVRNGAQIEQIARMLERGDIEGALRAVGISEARFRELDRALADAYEAGGTYTGARIPATVSATGLRTVFLFSVRNPRAEDWLRNYSSNLIREIMDDQRIAIRNFLRAGMEQGANPRTTALDLVGRLNKATGNREGGVIGLTSSQEGWVRKYAEELRTNDANALTRALRDKRFDPSVRKAIASGQPISADTQAKMVRAYRNRALRFRAEAIARTETLRSLHAGQDEALKQAIEQGILVESQVMTVWRTARDERVRATHAEMDGQKRAFGVPFDSPSGAKLLYPGDPDAPASETINCRCYREPAIDYLQGIK